MRNHTYRTVDVPVAGGGLRVGVWDPVGLAGTHSDAVSDPDGTVPTVLVLHGVTSSHLAWQLLAPKRTGVRVLAPDLRGRGASNSVQGAAGMRAHANRLLRLSEM